MTEEATPPLKLAITPNPKVTFAVAFEDAHLLVIDKPAGLVVQPGKGHSSDALLNGLFAKYGKLLHNLGVRRDYGLLHRLDRETSGLLVVAKMPNAYDELRRAFEERRVEKQYLTIVAGTPTPPQGVVQARLREVVVPTGEHTTIKKVLVTRQGEEAISAYRVVARTQRASLLRVTIKTGRLHQIRAHMLYLGTPVAGDTMYVLGPGKGGGLPRPPRLALHAAHLGFKHPVTGQWLNVESPLPPDLARYAKNLGLPQEGA